MKKLEEKVEKVMGIITGAGYGCNDIMQVCLHFAVNVNESAFSGQIMYDKKADDFIKAYKVCDVHDLNGKPVWIEDDRITMRNPEPCIID